MPISSPPARRLALTALLVVAVLAVVLGTTAGGGHRAGDELGGLGAEPAVAADGPSTPSTGVTTTAPAGERVTLAFGGDVHFEGELAARLAANPARALAPAAPLLAGADVAVVNLETAITSAPDRGARAPKQYAFRAPPTAFAALAGAGVDAATMANNHGLDYGPVGVGDALAAARSGPVQLIGIGRDAPGAFTPAMFTVRGRRIAVLAATQVLDRGLAAAWTAGTGNPGLASAKDPTRLLGAVENARRTADTVVVYLHWGVEGQTCPSVDQKTLARRLVGAGADVVVGGHSHRLQGAGRMGDAVVAYGLGNFAFYAKRGPATTSGALHVTVDGRRVVDYRWRPAVIRGGVPMRLPSGAEADRAIEAWHELRGCTGLDR